MIVAGFGFRAGASVASLRSAYELAAPGHTVTALATASDKARDECLTDLAGVLGLPVLAIDPDAIRSMHTLTRSPRVAQTRGTGSLAEAAALAASGPGARLIAPRHISPDRLATCAIAIGVEP